MMDLPFDVSELSRLDELQRVYQQLCSEEESTVGALNNLLKQRDVMETRLSSLQKELTNLHLALSDAEELVNMTTFTSQLAENVSGKVRQLDLTKSRVSSCMRRVEDILDVKFCTDGVQAALQNEDYEQAAAHIHRYLSLDENVLKSTAQNITEGSTLDTSFSLLHEAEAKLRNIVIRKFDEAVRDEDLASVERFFKIFPLLNQHDEGLKKFSIYLSSQIADTAQKNLKEAVALNPSDKRANIVFADTVTLLFEGIARIIEIQQPLVETYYGPGRLLMVVEHLQKECDRQVKKIVDKFHRARQFHLKVNQVAALSGTSHLTTESHLDPREVDILLGEAALISNRAELYIRFLRRRMTSDVEVAYQDPDARRERLQMIDKLIKECELSCAIQELLGHYIMMEEYFLRESVVKAINMDYLEPESLTSSSVDDVFFIVKKCIRRAVSSSSIDGICATINNACTVIESVFLETLKTQIKNGFPSGTLDFVQAYNVLQGKPQSVDNERAKLLYLVALNNLDVASEYTSTLKKTLEQEIIAQLTSTTGAEQGKIESCLAELITVSNQFNNILDHGMREVGRSAVRPRLRPLVDPFLSVSHELSEEEYDNFEVNDPFIQNFIVSIDSLLSSFKGKLTDSNYEKLVSFVIDEITMQLEKVVMKSTFNRLGGLQFDKELRSLVGYLTGTITWSIRDKLIRLTQIATVLNLDKVSEIFDYCGTNSGHTSWRLSPSDVKRILSLRSDFSKDEVYKLKL